MRVFIVHLCSQNCYATAALVARIRIVGIVRDRAGLFLKGLTAVVPHVAYILPLHHGKIMCVFTGQMGLGPVAFIWIESET